MSSNLTLQEATEQWSLTRQAYLDSVIVLQATIDRIMLAEMGVQGHDVGIPSQEPIATSGDPVISLGLLGFHGSITKALSKAGIDTVDELWALVQKPQWWVDVSGMGIKSAQRVVDTLGRYTAGDPELPVEPVLPEYVKLLTTADPELEWLDVGNVYQVERWDGGNPVVRGAIGDEAILFPTEWEAHDPG
jgi:hypothetical protein